MLWLYAGLSLVAYFWWAFLVAGMGLLLWAGFIHPEWQKPRSLRLRRWLEASGWSLLGLGLLGGALLLVVPPMHGPK